MLWFLILCFVPPLALSAALTEFARRVAPRFGLVDQPAARKVHREPTPLGGGLAVVTSVLATTGAALVGAWLLRAGILPAEWVPSRLAPHAEGALSRLGEVLVILAAGLILAVTGLIDDWRPLPWRPRLVVQLTAAFAVALFGPQVTAFVGSVPLQIAITVFWIVLLINSFNFLDNMNGLSAGVAMIAASVTAAIMLSAFAEPRYFIAGGMLILAGALLGFLVQNWSGRIFMGDAGSTFVGLLMGAYTAAATFYASELGSRHVIVAPLCILAVPLYDTASVILIRLREGRSPFEPDKRHFSHRLVEMGMRSTSAVLMIYLATATTGLAGLLLYSVPGWPAAAVILLLVACVLSIIAVFETVGTRRRPTQPGAAPQAVSGSTDE